MSGILTSTLDNIICSARALWCQVICIGQKLYPEVEEVFAHYTDQNTGKAFCWVLARYGVSCPPAEERVWLVGICTLWNSGKLSESPFIIVYAYCNLSMELQLGVLFLLSSVLLYHAFSAGSNNFDCVEFTLTTAANSPDCKSQYVASIEETLRLEYRRADNPDWKAMRTITVDAIGIYNHWETSSMA